MFVPSPESAKILKWLAQFGATSAAVLALKTCGPWEWEAWGRDIFIFSSMGAAGSVEVILYKYTTDSCDSVSYEDSLGCERFATWEEVLEYATSKT